MPVNIQSRTTQVRSTIIAGIANSEPVLIDYLAANGIRSQRVVRPHTLERCRNGRTVVRAFDPQRKSERAFVLDRVKGALAV